MTALMEQVGEMIARLNRSEKAAILQWVVAGTVDHRNTLLRVNRPQ